MKRLRPVAAYAVSAAVHAAAFLALARVEAAHLARDENVSVEVVETAPPPKVDPPAPTPAPRNSPHASPLAPPRDAPPPRPDPSPPPPNAEPPPDAAPPTAAAPVRIGISMSSATTGGTFSAPAGNTLYGQMPRTAPSPAEVKPYRSEKYVPPTQVTVLPKPVGDCVLPASDYPAEASRLGIEGVVVLIVTVDEHGEIADARVVEDPGHGLGAAAAAGIRRHCRVEAARRGDDAVPPVLTVRFELP